jgi:hypothetical protein
MPVLAGPSKCWVVGLVQLMGKTLGDGFAAKGALRHKEPLLCAQGALGRWLITRFTLQEEAFPGPTSPEWKETMLWPAREPTRPMTYQNQTARLAALYAKLEIFIEKVTHACRIFAARYAEEAGLSDVVSVTSASRWPQPCDKHCHTATRKLMLSRAGSQLGGCRVSVT